jgi:hypothetical protein
MAGEEVERVVEAKDSHIVLDQNRLTVQFRVEDLVRMLQPEVDLPAHCGGCDGCMGCSM